MNKPILSVKKLRVQYPIKSGVFFPKEISRITAVDDVSFDIFPGETFL